MAPRYDLEGHGVFKGVLKRKKGPERGKTSFCAVVRSRLSIAICPVCDFAWWDEMDTELVMTK